MLVFNYEGITDINTFRDDDGMYWFNGSNICTALGFKNPPASIQLHTDDDERKLVDNVIYVSEPGVWGLVLAYKTSEKGKKFKSWMKRYIYPNIRAESYRN